MHTYDPQALEAKWQLIWQDSATFSTQIRAKDQAKSYVLEMFPYPSGAGIHIGHALTYTGGDVIARVARKKGMAVLHPMGWDAFGLPAENYAIKSGVHPSITTKENSDTFRKQIKRLGVTYDWNKEINTSDPEYYKWTQWLFSLLYKKGLAYRKSGTVNWCPKDQTVLANEQVVGGYCERCGTQVTQKEMKQWYFKITDYAERLLTDLEPLDWPEKIKLMQRNWIGKSVGAYFEFDEITVFTTRPDTLAGATFLVLAPEHPAVSRFTTEEQKKEVTEYRKQAALQSELERTFTDRVKTGVWTGSYAKNPLTGEAVPIWIADYVLATYGTGAIMAVPAHDSRDFEFASTYNLPIRAVIESPDGVLPYSGNGKLLAPASLVGLPNVESGKQIIELAKGEVATTYRLRDWLISRQRYWGAPIPIVYDQAGAEHLIPESELPVLLPMDVSFQLTGESPLARATTWKTINGPLKNEKLIRETDTMDGFVCSSWYFLRYPTPDLVEAAFSKEAVGDWLPVDTYVGGAEHAVLHLLYARFITKVLFDEGLVPFNEPFQQLRNQGMVLGPDHQKMSKSKGNVINPDEVIAQWGADSLRTYALFMGPFDAEKPWNTDNISGSRRFLERVWNLQEQVVKEDPSDAEQRVIHPLIMQVDQALGLSRFNVAVAAMMGALNDLSQLPKISVSGYKTLLSLLNPIAPHITDELWSVIGGEGLCSLSTWPEADSKWLTKSEVEYPIQINGKVRQKIMLPTGLTEVEILARVHLDPVVIRYLDGKETKREIVILEKLVSLVV